MSARDGFDRSLPYRSLSRRDFLGRAGLLTGGLLALGPGGLLARSSQAQVTKAAGRAFAPATYLLSIDGAPAGFVQSFSGGGARGEVIAEPGAGFVQKKRLGAPLYEPIRIRAGIGSMSPAFYERVGAALKGNFQRINGTITVADLQGQAQRELEFFNALVSELTLPALDTAGKELAYLDVTLVPEHTRTNDAGGKKLAGDLVKGQKKSMLSNFRLEIDGLEQSCKHVNKIEALSFKQSAISDRVGASRDYMMEPGKIEVPNLVFSLATAQAAELVAWHKSFVIDGKNGEADEKSGTLFLLGPDLASSLLELKFANLGIFGLSQESSTGDAVARMKAELYCESMALEVPGAVKA